MSILSRIIKVVIDLYVDVFNVLFDLALHVAVIRLPVTRNAAIKPEVQYGNVVLDSFNKASRDEDNILD